MPSARFWMYYSEKKYVGEIILFKPPTTCRTQALVSLFSVSENHSTTISLCQWEKEVKYGKKSVYQKSGMFTRDSGKICVIIPKTYSMSHNIIPYPKTLLVTFIGVLILPSKVKNKQTKKQQEETNKTNIQKKPRGTFAFQNFPCCSFCFLFKSIPKAPSVL